LFRWLFSSYEAPQVEVSWLKSNGSMTGLWLNSESR
jgi:hypothetical protein